MESGKTKLAFALIAATFLAASCCTATHERRPRLRPTPIVRRSRDPREKQAEGKALLVRIKKMAQIGDLQLANNGLPQMIGGGGSYMGDNAYDPDNPATIAKAGLNLLNVTLYAEKNRQLFSESVTTDTQGNPQSPVTPSRPIIGKFPVCAYTPQLTCTQ